MLEKTDGAIRNKEFRDTVNIGHTKHKTTNKIKARRKTNTKSNMDPIKNTVLSKNKAVPISKTLPVIHIFKYGLIGDNVS